MVQNYVCFFVLGLSGNGLAGSFVVCDNGHTSRKNDGFLSESKSTVTQNGRACSIAEQVRNMDVSLTY